MKDIIFGNVDIQNKDAPRRVEEAQKENRTEEEALRESNQREEERDRENRKNKD